MKNFIRFPVFCNNPLSGYFKYKDEFQLYPLSSLHLDVNDSISHKPLLIEVGFENANYSKESTNVEKIQNRMKVRVDDINLFTPAINKILSVQNLLTAFSNYRFFSYPNESSWFLPIVDDVSPTEKSKSVWGKRWFSYPELSQEYPARISGISENLSCEEIERVSLVNYFIKPQIEDSRSIVFISELEVLLDKYYGLSHTKKEKIDSICKLISNGINLFNSSISLSFVAFISCIEALTNLEYADENKNIEYSCGSCKQVKSSPYSCEKCKQPTWGISYKFKKFLTTYVSNTDESKRIFNKLYNLRCKIVHEGQLLLGDSFMDLEKQEKLESQWELHFKTQQITRIALINWLLSSPKSTEL